MKIGLVNLGCPKNQVDSEIMLGLLHDAGFEFTSNEKDAEIIVVNTCGFIDSAKEESITTLIELGRLKTEGKCRLLVAAGCLPQRYKEDLLKEMPEIDVIAGTGSFRDVISICIEFRDKQYRRLKEQRAYLAEPSDFSYELSLPRIRISEVHTAFIKIAEGCDHTCTFCIIPELRGRQRSRSMESIIAEAEKLSSEGVVEINLIAQDSTAYGRDLREPRALARLLKKLASLKGIKWIRILYTYPGSFTNELISVMADEEKVCKYIDMPVQHVSDSILRRMQRGHTKSGIYRTIEKLRSKIPDVVLRTSLIVGFPGETERQFNELKSFVEDVEFDRLGVFTYSHEEGTEAYSMKQQVGEKKRLERQNIIMEIQQGISLRKNQKLIGTRQIVLVDSISKGEEFQMEGRTCGHAPEVDGVVYIKCNSERLPAPGEMVSVRIEDALPYDLAGTVIQA
ncbi:MAG: 30S ribosomal protein S12 methylthiotransferase RimO [Nitrospirae bacterium]|nr:30S ribosomal protein S12 methylthiotransferase RimO [Nitrospirota bacterium]